MKKQILLVFVLFLLLLCCGTKEKKVERYMEDGVEVVHNIEMDLSKTFKDFNFVEDLIIGVEEGDENYMFAYPADIESDEEGNIYILDYRDCVVRKYDSQGKFLKQFGRKGQGPGEFQAPYCMFLTPQNKIYVKDAGANKIEEFSLDGIHQKTHSFDMLYFFKVNKNNDFIVDFSTFNEDGIRYICVGKVDFQKNKPDAFLCERQYWPARWSDNDFVYDYPYYIRWDINSKDNIYAASAVGYEISVFDPNGKLLFKFNKDFNPVPVTAEELAKISESRNKVTMDRGPNPYNSKLVYPAFKYIAIDDKDRIWIEHYQPAWINRINERTIYDVFSSDGVFLFTTKIPGHIYPQLVFKNGYIYAFRKYESGYSQAVRIKMIE